MKTVIELEPHNAGPSNNIADKERSVATLGQIAVADYRNILVLNKYGLDYSFSGKYTLEEACLDANVSLADVDSDLKAIQLQPRIYNVNFSEWAADYLADFIVSNHHQFVRKSLLRITEEFHEVLKSSGEQYPFLGRVGEVFQRIATDLSAYLVEEEQVIFPYIRFLVQARKSNMDATCLPPGCLEHRLNFMEIEQRIVGENIAFIRKLCNNYRLGDDTANGCASLFQMLNEFDNDLQQHVHLENNILFPKAIELEKECLARSPGHVATEFRSPKNPIQTIL